MVMDDEDDGNLIEKLDGDFNLKWVISNRQNIHDNEEW